MTLRWIEAVKPERAILTNLHITMDYQTLLGSLPEGVEPAYDGLTIDFKA
jgi:phosphoribosyl 1,2-cyclic phosphate phosphodiesterase